MKVIGVDIGGTKIEAALIENGVVKNISRAETLSFTNKYLILHNIEHCISEVFVHDVQGIGIGIPGIADKSGKILFMSHIKKIIGVNLNEFISEKFNKPTSIENDAKCFTLAEYLYGAGKDHSNVVGLILGTGIGAGLILDDKLYRGTDGGAGELGHNLIFLNNKKLAEFEELCSANAVIKKQKKLSKNLSKEFYKYLAVNIANIVNIFNPEIIVIGGGLSNYLDYKLLNKKVKSYSIPVNKNSFKIVKNKLGSGSGLIGAAGLVSFNK